MSGALYDFNQTRPLEQEKRQDLMKKMFAEVGRNCYIEPPFHTNWGSHVHFGNQVYANFNLTLVDDTDIYVGDFVMFGPNVVIDTAAHPIHPDCGKRWRSTTCRFSLAIMSGLVREPSSCQVFVSVITALSAPAVWLQRIFRKMWLRLDRLAV